MIQNIKTQKLGMILLDICCIFHYMLHKFTGEIIQSTVVKIISYADNNYKINMCSICSAWKSVIMIN